MKRWINIISIFTSITISVQVGEKAFEFCKKQGLSMFECQNILHPEQRIRVPIDLLMFPHMVLIGFRRRKEEEPHWKCGGSVISAEWVLTAAHCIEDPDDGPANILRVGTGTFEFDETDDLVQERRIHSAIAHPNYKPPSKYHDIALMKADVPFVLNHDIRVACLHLDNKIENSSLTAVGFGKTLSAAVTGSQTLMKVDVSIVENEICNKTMKPLIKRRYIADGITDDQLCAGDYEHGGKDTCQGDSGGPLQITRDQIDCVKTFPLPLIVGVTSFGRDCGRKMAPGVYVNVFKYVGWIESIVWP